MAPAVPLSPSERDGLTIQPNAQNPTQRQTGQKPPYSRPASASARNR
jgi:hypothetical protein